MKQFSAFVRSFNFNVLRRYGRALALAMGALAFSASSGFAFAEAPQAHGFLELLHKRKTLASTIPANGDTNPYAVIIAPVSSGSVQKGDVLIDNFNNQSNLQGTGTTIVDYNPATKKTSLFAKLPQHLAGCPGGIGLSTAMTMLTSGWVIVGSTNSNDGTTRTKGDGCLVVLDSKGTFVTAWSGPNINSPWGDMATIDNGTSATLFVSMAGFDVPGPEVHDPLTGTSKIVRKATVLRIGLAIPEGKPPTIESQTVIANGFGQRADKDSFLVGPTGITLGLDKALYVSDALGNQIVRIPDAIARTTSAGTGEVVTKDGLLKRPLAIVTAPNGNLVSVNALNGQFVETDPATGKQLYAQWVDVDQAQSPPGNGDLFGLAIKPDGRGIYYIQDDVNALVEDVP